MSRNGQTIKDVKHFARYYRDNMEYKTNYRIPLKGWTAIDEMDKSYDLISETMSIEHHDAMKW